MNSLPASTLSFDYINGTVAAAVSSKEADLRSTIAALGANATATDLLVLQQRSQEWTMMIQIQSTLVQNISEAMKGVIQKSA